MKLKQYFEFSFKEYSSVGQKYFAEIDVKLAEKMNLRYLCSKMFRNAIN